MNQDPFALTPPPQPEAPQASLLDNATQSLVEGVDAGMNYLVGLFDRTMTGAMNAVNSIPSYNVVGAIASGVKGMAPSFTFNSGPSTTTHVQGRARGMDGPELQRSIDTPSTSVSQTHSFSAPHNMEIANIAQTLSCLGCGTEHQMPTMSAAALATCCGATLRKEGQSQGMMH